jgi:glycosyltransferase involved in cell wall biosynthesis
MLHPRAGIAGDSTAAAAHLLAPSDLGHRTSSPSAIRTRTSVLHIVAPAAVGGLESVVRLLSHAQCEHGQQVCVAIIVDAGRRDHPLAAQLAELGVPCEIVEVPPRAYAFERRAIAALCANRKPDVVHTHGYRPDVMDAGVARGMGIATVTTVHGFTGNGWRNRFYEHLQRRSYRRFDAVVAVSRPLVERLRRSGVPAERVCLVPNAYRRAKTPLDRRAARERLGLREDVRVVGWVGRLQHEKGPDVLLDAVASSQFPGDVLVSIVGSGRDREALAERARTLGIAHRVKFHGLVADAERVFPAFDTLVLSSRTEGTPMVLFEAMATRTPIVATSVGGVPDVLPGDSATLVPSERPAMLARAIAETLQDRAEASRRASIALERLDTVYGTDPWVAAYENVYHAARRLTAARLPC